MWYACADSQSLAVHTSWVSHPHPVLRSLTSTPNAAVWDPYSLCPSLSISFLPSANTSLLQGFWCQPASQLARDQLATLIRRMETQHVLLGAWQVSGGPYQNCLGVEGKGRLPGEGPQGRAGREASLAEDPGSKGQECGARTRSSSPEHKGPVLESCTIVSS